MSWQIYVLTGLVVLASLQVYMELSEFQIRLHILFHLITKPFKAVETCLETEVSHVKYLLENWFF